MAEIRTASVTLRDLANDLTYWLETLESWDKDEMGRAMGGLKAIVDILLAYSDAGYRIEP